MPLRRHIRIIEWRMKRWADRAEAKLTDLLYGRTKAKGRLWILWGFLKGLEGVFKTIVKLRGKLYQLRIFKQAYLGCLVIVIGNVTVGGTGKTPVVEKLARELTSRGRKVAILSRGYRRKEAGFLIKLLALFDEEAAAPVVVSDGQKIRCDWRKAGDEPYMLAQNLPGVAVIVDKNRVKAGAYAIKKFGVDTLLLDDGFQYWPLKSHHQLVLVDQSNPFGNGHMLPRGILREPVAALKRASFIFITKSDGNPSDTLLKTINKHAPHVSPIVCAHAPKSLNALDGTNVEPLEILKGKKVFAFSGIAVPESFEKLLKASGAKLMKSFHYTDHYAYEPEDIEQVIHAAESLGVDMIVTTEKDSVRLPYFKTSIPAYYLRMEVEILSGAKDFGAALKAITEYKNNNTPVIFGD